MKLRIKGDSLRLRVTRSELEQFLTSGRIAETVHFAPQENAKLTYSLQSAAHARVETDAVSVRYAAGEVAVVLPAGVISAWSAPSEVGVYAKTSLAEGELDLAVEKDFACLDRSDEENSDTFPNPLLGQKC